MSWRRRPVRCARGAFGRISSAVTQGTETRRVRPSAVTRLIKPVGWPVAGRCSYRPDANVVMPTPFHLGCHGTSIPGLLPGIGHPGLGGSVGWQIRTPARLSRSFTIDSSPVWCWTRHPPPESRAYVTPDPTREDVARPAGTSRGVDGVNRRRFGSCVLGVATRCHVGGCRSGAGCQPSPLSPFT